MSKVPLKILDSANVDPSVNIGIGSTIWHLAQVREGAVIGSNCVIGRGAYIGSGVRLGNNCKVQNFALLYEPAVLGNGVFIGPGAILTNDQFPRAVNIDGSIKGDLDWNIVGVEVGDGASIGARAVCVAPVKIGSWSMVAAGAVVTKDVPNFALVMGVPARKSCWVGHAGYPLVNIGGNNFRCPVTNSLYKELAANELVEVNS